jgi:hypothetical protein
VRIMNWIVHSRKLTTIPHFAYEGRGRLQENYAKLVFYRDSNSGPPKYES